MASQDITLGDNTIVTLTYDDTGRVLTISSPQPVFFFVFGGDQVFYIGTFTDNVILNITYLFSLIYPMS